MSEGNDRSKFRGNVSNNAKRSEIGSWSLLLRFDGDINHSIIALGDIGEELKIKSCGFSSTGFIVKLHVDILDSSTNNRCGFSTTAPYYEGFWFEI
ncbi:hypothetical protein CDAR_270181 [Caerostris darwini]|uniref:LAGLIDADG homing endonuclease n=1 Tax=Caerostris darwini TaxID=1538125 RepID=A0AAV4UM01_9ARAC|nr:hypothetical protein CDAR_270181 [Caerostris darwini]